MTSTHLLLSTQAPANKRRPRVDQKVRPRRRGAARRAPARRQARPRRQGRRHDFHRANAFRRARRGLVLGVYRWLGRGLDRKGKPGFAPGVGGGHGGRVGRCGFDTRLGCFGVRHTFYWRRRVVRAVFGRGMRRRLRFRRLRVWFKCAASFCSSRLYGRADVGDSHGRSGRPRGRAPAVLWRTHVGSRRDRGMPSRMVHGLARFQCSIQF